MFAVYIPLHEPVEGQAFYSMSSKSSCDIAPAIRAPTASKADTIDRSWPFHRPGMFGSA